MAFWTASSKFATNPEVVNRDGFFFLGWLRWQKKIPIVCQAGGDSFYGRLGPHPDNHLWFLMIADSSTVPTEYGVLNPSSLPTVGAMSTCFRVLESMTPAGVSGPTTRSIRCLQPSH